MIDYDNQTARMSRTQGRIRGTGWGMSYPSPFFDVAHTYLPDTVKQMFRWCRYYTLTNPLIAAVVYKMSEYPVTDIVIDSDNDGTKKLWSSFFEDILQMRAFLIDIGLFYNCYGIALVSINYPFRKFLVCRNCKNMVLASKAKFRFRNFKFFLQCKCGAHQEAEAKDVPIRSPNEIRLMLWNPEDINIKYNDLTGKSVYYYTIPLNMRNDIVMGKKDLLVNTPQIFIDAIRQQKSVVLNPDNIFQYRRPSILTGSKDRAWGVPLILPVLKDVFYLQVLKKAQECVSLDTMIETRSGLVAADDVAIGDIVRAHTGEWRKVSDKWYRDAKEGEIGRKITLASARALPSTYSPNHPVFSIRRNDLNRRKDTKEQQKSSVILRNPHLYEEVLCPAAELSVGDYVLYPRYLPTRGAVIDAAVTGLHTTDNWVYSGGCSVETAEAFESLERGEELESGNPAKVAKRTMKEGRTPKRLRRFTTLSPKLSYALGWYAGDGSVGKGHVAISMGLEDDPAEFCRAIMDEFGVQPRCSTIGNVLNVDVNDVILCKLFKALIPGRAPDKAVPPTVMDSRDECKLAFLRGLWEADGYVGDKSATLSTSSKDLAYGVYRLLLHFGCIPNIVVHRSPPSVLFDGRVIKETSAYHVSVSTASRDRLALLFSVGSAEIEVKSGKSGFFWGDNYFASRVCAIEESEEEQYIDFKVEKDTTFCTPGAATKNSIALERIVPLTVLFPQPGSGSSDPYSTISLSRWREQVGLEVQRWRFDRNYMPIMPLPIGSQNIGGDGRALMLGQEIRIWSEHIIAGMGVPQEFVFGGLQYSGSNVSLRMLENQLLRYVSDQLRMIKNFVVKNIAAWMDWPLVNVRFKPFKMADDLQRRAFDFQLNQAGKLSDTSLLANCDYDPVREDEQMAKETIRRLEAVGRQQRAEAQIAVDTQVIQAKGQAKVQQVMAQEQQQAMEGQANAAPGESQEGQQQQALPAQGQQGQQQQGGDPRQSMAQQMAQRLVQYPPEQQQQIINQIAQQDPELAQMVSQLVAQMSGQAGGRNSAGKPLPEQLPARRGPESAMM